MAFTKSKGNIIINMTLIYDLKRRGKNLRTGMSFKKTGFGLYDYVSLEGTAGGGE
jgi:hypothetical protein